MTFFEKLEKRISSVDSILCLGLDPRESELEDFSTSEHFDLFYDHYVIKQKEGSFKITERSSIYVQLRLFCQYILDSTIEHVCCVKPNLAFFIAHLAQGIEALLDICLYLKKLEIPVLIDAKLGDIGSTTEYYKKFIFESLMADACTINVFLGTDVLQAMTTSSEGEYKNTIFALALCSNPSSTEFQGALLANTKPMYMEVVEKCETFLKGKSPHSLCGYVVGATYVDVIKDIRERYQNCYFLVPGIGTQGGDLHSVLSHGLNSKGRGLIVPISRAITNAKDPGQSAKHWKEEIRTCIQHLKKSN
ncbi:orotidine 5'-phosphate decarboxylase, putative [Theileria equi strain WA]|uniref:Orotidine 5'-phosphate decarboxylase n=1 Tax=Theileria equi strain WA TaxID=1537102 RepID=L1LGQ3_THEEQ|nr:orotidine 5'-phosphate decarboxylase, putative [Theileria equi strain WA]EKX74293.1 orotidine 5'-phosphate decarboxylase, putative [Theileria equi strain WA]|eukprot:XP_004833745.1 orotidine 5'-phosphate decarboxylase, putative [Theileria equi strain WA]